MDEAEFESLAMRVMTREASAEDEKRLEELVSRDPLRRTALEELREAYILGHQALPLTEAVAATEPALPEYRTGELRSAVRAHFGARKKEPIPSTVLRWWPWLISISGAAAVVALVIFGMGESVAPIEFGMYTQSATRGGAALHLIESKGIKVTEFDRDEPFARWAERPLGRGQKAKIWIDEEHNIIQLQIANANGPDLRETRPLPASTSERELLLNSLIVQLAHGNAGP